MNRAAELRQEIREAWSHMVPPVLPPPLREDWIEYPDTYRAVNGTSWESINLGPSGDLHEQWNDCWIESVRPRHARVYYYAVFLDYFVKYYEEYQRDTELQEFPDGDIPFMCAVCFTAERLLDDGDWKAMTRRQLRVTLAVLEFARAHWPAYGFPDEAARDDDGREFNRKLRQSLESSIVRVRRLLLRDRAESTLAE